VNPSTPAPKETAAPSEPGTPPEASPIVEAKGVSRAFRGRSRRDGSVLAVDDVSLGLRAGETVGLVGESGSGKSTLGRLLVGLDHPTGGEVRFEGRPLGSLDRAENRRFRRTVQIVFQDPYASLNPRLTVGAAIREVLTVHAIVPPSATRTRTGELLERVGLDSADARRYPHEFSGGQRQRIGIARALAVEPRILVADEPVSALDVSVQAKIIVLLRQLQRDLGLGYLFVSHDLAVVRAIATEVAIMQRGRIVERGPTSQVYDDPRHPYTKSLLSAIPRLSTTA